MKQKNRIWCVALSTMVCPNEVGAMASMNIYHEKQVKELCALHALNNLFQSSAAFTKQQLDEICYNLSPNHFLNPHKSILGLGNYDINVIMAALQMRGCEAIWFDKRKDPACLNVVNIHGFILNIPSEYRFGFFRLPIHRKHWIAIREVNSMFYNLDSKLDHPELIGKERELLNFLRDQIDSSEREIFVIVKREVEETQAWRKESREFNTGSDSVEFITASEGSTTPESQECSERSTNIVLRKTVSPLPEEENCGSYFQ